VETNGLNSMYSPQPPRKKSKPQKEKKQEESSGVLGTGKQEIQKQINAAVNSRTQGVADIVRGPDKRERLEEFLLMKLPYRPQWVRKGTRFDADLRESLQFGNATVTTEMLRLLGSSPASDSIVHARLVTPLNSNLAKQGESVQAVISQPLFSADKKLILPEGTHLIGGITMVHRARWFHRGGQLRFNFQKVELPAAFIPLAVAADNTTGKTTLASLEAAESSGSTAIKVDKEGSVKAVEPKTRLIAPAISVLIAAKSQDEDRERMGGHDANVSGRTLGGASGFGLLGAAAAQASRTVGSVLGFYGMAWSVYSNVVSRGAEVEFKENAAIDFRFGSRAPAHPSKFRQSLEPVAAGAFKRLLAEPGLSEGVKQSGQPLVTMAARKPTKLRSKCFLICSAGATRFVRGPADFLMTGPKCPRSSATPAAALRYKPKNLQSDFFTASPKAVAQALVKRRRL
jgi:hypothetical protein